MKLAVFSILAGVSLGGLATYSARAQTLVADPQSLLGPQSSSRGGTSIASPVGHDALFSNPAAAAFSDRYSINFGYVGAGDGLAASVVDTKSGPVGGALYYLKRDFKRTPDSNPSAGPFARLEERAGGALFGRISPNVSFGTNIKYTYRRAHDSIVSTTSQWTFDVGALFRATDELSIGAVGQNLVGDDSSLNPRSMGAAASYRVGSALFLNVQVNKLLELDTAVVGSGFGYGVGADYLLPQNFTLRAGYRDTGLYKEKLMSAGLGYESKTFGASYSFQFGVGGSGKKAQIHGVQISGYL